MPARRGQRPERGARAQRGPNAYEDDTGAPPLRKKSGNEGLWIALGIAGVVGILFILIISGSSSGDNDAYEARGALRRFFEAALNDQADVGEKLIIPREILRDQNPNEVKRWGSLSVKEQEKLTQEAFRWVRGRVSQSLQLGSMEEVDTMLNAADINPKPSVGRVDFQWKYGEDTWNAVMIKIGSDWLLERLDRRE